MNKQKFLNKLSCELRRLKKEERNRYLDYYDEIISELMEHDMTEEEAIARQGDINRITREILENTNSASLKHNDWRGIVLIAVTVILILLSMLPLLLKIQLGISMSSAVGVIGGADGPTSIFVAGKIGTPWGLYIAAVVVTVVTIIYFMKKHRR